MGIHKESLQSLFLEIKFNGVTIATGTGFVAESKIGPVLITNRHNVTGLDYFTGKCLSPNAAIPSEILIYHNKLNEVGTWITTLEPLFKDEKQLWFEHTDYGAKVDFVALPLTQLNDVHIYSYTLGIGDAPLKLNPPDIVSVIGFPFGLAAGGCLGVWTTGFIASEPEINYLGLPIFLIDSRTRPGQSGSPVLAFRNSGVYRTENDALTAFDRNVYRFMGIYSGRINEQSDLGLVWKTEAIKKFVDSLI